MQPLSHRGEFDKFLFALIDDDKIETPLSVLSVLARLNLDPWAEAAALAQMPRPCAVRRLGSLIDALPDRSTQLDVVAISGRLIALLPPPRGSDNSIRPRLQGVGVLTTTQIAKTQLQWYSFFFSIHRLTSPNADTV